MDYTHDQLSSERKCGTLNLKDGYTREDLEVEVDTSLLGSRVVPVLELVLERRGTSERTEVDNLTEFTSKNGPSLGRSKSGGVALHQAWQVDAERIDRELHGKF